MAETGIYWSFLHEILYVHYSHWANYRSRIALNAVFDYGLMQSSVPVPLRSLWCVLGCQYKSGPSSLICKFHTNPHKSTQKAAAVQPPSQAPVNVSCIVWYWLFINCHQYLSASMLNGGGKASQNKTKAVKWQNATAKYCTNASRIFCRYNWLLEGKIHLGKNLFSSKKRLYYGKA